jgi:hypothetical protein
MNKKIIGCFIATLALTSCNANPESSSSNPSINSYVSDGGQSVPFDRFDPISASAFKGDASEARKHFVCFTPMESDGSDFDEARSLYLLYPPKGQYSPTEQNREIWYRDEAVWENDQMGYGTFSPASGTSMNPLKIIINQKVNFASWSGTNLPNDATICNFNENAIIDSNVYINYNGYRFAFEFYLRSTVADWASGAKYAVKR